LRQALIETSRQTGGRIDRPQTTAKLSVPEVFALIIGISSMHAAGSLPFAGLADSGLSKIEKSLPRDKLRDLRRLLDCLYVGPLAP